VLQITAPPQCGLVSANGGNGGDNVDCCRLIAPGGGGGGGRVLIPLLPGASCPVSVQAGIAGRVTTFASSDPHDGALPVAPDAPDCVGLIETTGYDAGGSPGDGGSVAPRFISTGNAVAFCGAPYRYSSAHRPEVVGDGPLAFSVAPAAGEAAPAGFAVDPATGELEWVPGASDVGAHHFVLTVEGPGGSASQDVEIDVECAAARQDRAWCGCGTGDLGLLMGVAAIAAASKARRRRSPTSRLR
jgi:hypothetical protein